MPTERDAVRQYIKASRNSRGGLQELVTLGLLTYQKWDRAVDGNKNATAVDAAAMDRFTDVEFQQLSQKASDFLNGYVATLPERGGWWRGFWQSYAASWGYAISLVLAALVIKSLGSDILTLGKELFLKQ